MKAGRSLLERSTRGRWEWRWGGVSGFGDERIGDVVTEVLKGIELPYDLFGFRFDLDEDGLVGAGVAVADEVVAVREELEGGDPGEGDSREVFLGDFPDDLLGRVDLEDRVAVAGGDEGVAIRQAEGGEHGVSEGFRSVAIAARLIEERDFVFPDDRSLFTVFADSAVAFMADEVGALRGEAGEACIAMGVGLVDFEGEGAGDFALRGDFDHASRAAFGDDDVAVGEWLEGVDFDGFALVAI